MNKKDYNCNHMVGVHLEASDIVPLHISTVDEWKNEGTFKFNSESLKEFLPFDYCPECGRKISYEKSSN